MDDAPEESAELLQDWLDRFPLDAFLRPHVAEVFRALPGVVRDDLVQDPSFVLFDYEPGGLMHVPVAAPRANRPGRSVVLKRTLRYRPGPFVRWLIAHEVAHAAPAPRRAVARRGPGTRRGRAGRGVGVPAAEVMVGDAGGGVGASISDEWIPSASHSFIAAAGRPRWARREENLAIIGLAAPGWRHPRFTVRGGRKALVESRPAAFRLRLLRRFDQGNFAPSNTDTPHAPTPPPPTSLTRPRRRP